MVTLENILDHGNLVAAMWQVIENKGAAGVDGMEVTDLEPYVIAHVHELTESIMAGKYRPQPVRCVYIPKEEKGKVRGLGIPTVVDRMIQQAVAQRLSQEYEPVFSNSSHGFRPNRSCHTAIDQVLEYANQGYEWVVDMDLRKFFDTVNHAKLLQVLSKRIKDGRVISLIHRMLMAPIAEGGKLTPSTLGTPQGGCVSPVLANILLDELDKELEKRGHRFVRYADDLVVLCRSKRSAERTCASLRRFIESKLLLQVNEEKTRIYHIGSRDLKFLGFGFWRSPSKKVLARPHQKAKAKCKAKLKEITSRSRGQSLDEFRRKLREFVVGWVNYFGKGSMKQFVRRTDEWLRRRIRQIYWKVWKKPRTKVKALRILGASPEKAYEWGNSRKAYWRIANSWILSTALTNDFLRNRGWICLGDVYKQ